MLSVAVQVAQACFSWHPHAVRAAMVSDVEDLSYRGYMWLAAIYGWQREQATAASRCDISGCALAGPRTVSQGREHPHAATTTKHDGARELNHADCHSHHPFRRDVTIGFFFCCRYTNEFENNFQMHLQLITAYVKSEVVRVSPTCG